MSTLPVPDLRAEDSFKGLAGSTNILHERVERLQGSVLAGAFREGGTSLGHGLDGRVQVSARGGSSCLGSLRGPAGRGVGIPRRSHRVVAMCSRTWGSAMLTNCSPRLTWRTQFSNSFGRRAC